MHMLSLLPLFLAPTLTFAVAAPSISYIHTAMETFAAGPSLTTYAPTVAGVSAGASIPSLTVTAWTKPNCAGGFQVSEKLEYGGNWSIQFNSIHLSRSLNGPERLDYFDALPQGGQLNEAYNGNLVTCSYYIGSLGGVYGEKGCHTIRMPVGCLKIFLPPAPAPS